MVDKIWYNMEELIGGSEERVLIETYWNVNSLPTESLNSSRVVVLIETYWNVNLVMLARWVTLAQVLIETYWNVNEDDLVFLKNSFAY